MSFFVRGGRGKRRQQVNAAEGRNKIARKNRKRGAEEISSDSDDEDIGKINGDEGDEEQLENDNETALEKRYRLAKEYLQQIEEEEKDKAALEEVDRDAVAHRLKEEVFEQAGKLHRKIADQYVPVSSTEFRFLRGHRLSPTCLRLSNDGRTIYSGSKDGVIIKWDLETGRRLHVIKNTLKDTGGNRKGHHGQISALAVSSDDKFLCSAGSDKVVITWDAKTMQHVKTFTGHRGPTSGLVFRRGKNQLFSCSHDRSLKIWNLDEMGYVDTMYGHQDSILDIDCLSKERAATCGGRDRTIRLWKIAEESQLVFHAHKNCGSIECLRLINDDHFVSGGDDGSLCIWSVMKKKPVCVVEKAHSGWISSVATQPYTDLIASGSRDGKVLIWQCSEDYKTLKLLHELKIGGFVNAMAFTHDMSYLVCAVGQEHKNGRWWRESSVKNSIVVCPLKKSTES